MSYFTNPMAEYNKNNPFVIICKREYDKLMDMAHGISKSYIKLLTISLILLFINVILSVIICINNFSSTIVGREICSFVMYTVFILLINIYFRFVVRITIHDHDAMRAFSDISELEINSIIKLENETILNCLHGLYYLEGLFEIRCRNVRTFLCVFIGEMILCLIVSSLRLLGNWG